MKNVPWWIGPTGWLFLALVVALAGCNDSGALVGDDDDNGGDDDDTGSAGEDDDDDAAPQGCGEDVEQALADIANWEELVSCGSMSMATAPDADQTLAVSIRLDLQAEDLEEGESISVALAGDGGSLHLETGENLLHYDCNDALWLEEIVEQRWEAVAGTALLDVVAWEDEWDVTARLELVGVVMRDPQDPGSSCAIPDTTWESLHIGWLPG